MTDIALALGGVDSVLVNAFDRAPGPRVLLSYSYYERFKRAITDGVIRDWVLDSGAYTAYHSGVPIQLEDYIAFCHERMQDPIPPAEIFALDAIGDHVTTLRNTEAMWAAGVPAIPCYHAGEPEEVLTEIAAKYPKIAVGGAAGRLFGHARHKFMEQCFARVWPKLIHGFGVNGLDTLSALPFDSVDASNWQLSPMRFGVWKAYGKTGIRTQHYLRPEVEHYLRLEAKLKAKWGPTLAKVRKEAACASTSVS